MTPALFFYRFSNPIQSTIYLYLFLVHEVSVPGRGAANVYPAGKAATNFETVAKTYRAIARALFNSIRLCCALCRCGLFVCASIYNHGLRRWAMEVGGGFGVRHNVGYVDRGMCVWLGCVMTAIRKLLDER